MVNQTIPAAAARLISSARMPGGWPVAIVALMLALLYLGNTPRAFGIVAFFAIVGFLALWAVIDTLLGRRWASGMLLVYGVLVGAVSLMDASGPYRFQGGAGLPRVKAGMVIDSWLYTHPASAKWQTIDKATFKPYVMVPNVEGDFRRIRVFVMGEDLSRHFVNIPPDSIGPRPFVPVPVPWSVIQANEYVFVRFVVEGTGTMRVRSTAWLPQGWHRRPQTITIDGETRTSMDYLRSQAEFTVQIRFADDDRRVAGVLF